MLQPTVETNTRQPPANGNLGERILARQAELEAEMATLDEGSAEYTAIDTALATLAQYLGADMNHLSDVTARDLNNWLERNKYIGLSIAEPAHSS